MVWSSLAGISVGYEWMNAERCRVCFAESLLKEGIASLVTLRVRNCNCAPDKPLALANLERYYLPSTRELFPRSPSIRDILTLYPEGL